MQRLRHATFLARLVLAWFALAMGAAVAAPVLQPGSIELLCTGTGAMNLLVKGAQGEPVPAGHSLDCPLCGAAAAPPPAAVRPAVPAALPKEGALQRTAPHVAVASGAPLPARGPPPAIA
jgi:hypothetical protein